MGKNRENVITVKIIFLHLKTSNMILIYVMIAIVVNKEKKCLKRPYFE